MATKLQTVRGPSAIQSRANSALHREESSHWHLRIRACQLHRLIFQSNELTDTVDDARLQV